MAARDEVVEAGAVGDADAAVRAACDERLRLEVRQGAGHDCRREVDVVGDVGRRQPQLDSFRARSPRMTLLQHVEEHRDPAGSVGPAHDEGVSLRFTQGVCRLAQQRERDGRLAQRHRSQLIERQLEERGCHDGFDRVDVAALAGEAREIAREEKREHATTAVRGLLEGAQHAAADAVDGVGRRAALEQDVMRRHAHADGNQRQALSIAAAQGGALCRQAERYGLNERQLGRHSHPFQFTVQETLNAADLICVVAIARLQCCCLITVMTVALDTPTPTVYIVDDDVSVRTAIQRLLGSVGLACEAFGSASELLARADSRFFGCIITDVRMPGPSGLELQRALAAGGNDIPIIFVTAHADVPLTVRAMKAGALEVLTKPFDDQVLIDAVHQALEQARTRKQDHDEIQRLRERFDTLTAREREVMALVVTGLLNKQIAALLGAGEKTIKVHRAQVMHKMDASSLADLVRMADRLGLSSQRPSGL